MFLKNTYPFKSEMEMDKTIKLGRNNLIVSDKLAHSLVTMKMRSKISIVMPSDLNYLYTFWKPSHFYTGLEVHSGKCSWRTFREGTDLHVGVKMFPKGNNLSVEIFSNKILTNEQIAQIKKRIVRSYGLSEKIRIPSSVISKNKFIKKIYPQFKGTRISCPESFFEISIISLLLQNTTISRTTTMFRKLMERYGRLVEFDDVVLFNFYAPSDVLSISEEELKLECRLGYRAKYIHNYAEFFCDHSEISLRKMSKEEIISALQRIKGVGTYTSNVVSASALRDSSSIPLDSWNRKILSLSLYNYENLSPECLMNNMNSDFGDIAGLIALYAIEYEYISKPVVPLLSF